MQPLTTYQIGDLSGNLIQAAKALGTPVSDIVRQAAFELELIELLDTSKDSASA